MPNQDDFERMIAAAPHDLVARGVYADWLEENGFLAEAVLQRSGGRMTGAEFRASVIAQDDDNEYSESGVVVCVVNRDVGEFALIGYYGHCSCYDTWSDLCGGGISDYFDADEVKNPGFTWQGSVKELVRLARGDMDPAVRGRKNADGDSEVDHLRACYAQVLEWAKQNGRF